MSLLPSITTVERATSAKPFGPHVLDIDLEAASREIEQWMRAVLGRELRKRGVVIGVSGGIDSSVCAALAARAIGPRRVHAVLMPERESSPRSGEMGALLCRTLGIEPEHVDITPALDALGCYEQRVAAVRQVFPDFPANGRFKITVADDVLTNDRLNYFNVVAETPVGVRAGRLPADAYLAILAATNMKQRVRKLTEYSRAERLNYAVIGTPNRLEFDQGFFVRGGDGLADLKPIAHLFKSQVYAMARHLGLPDAICRQSPTTDTYSLPQSQEEFYFAIPYQQMDLLIFALDHRIDADTVAAGMGFTFEQVQRAWRDIEAKRRASKQLHQPAILVRPLAWMA